MSFLLLLLIPFAIGGGCLILRRQRRLVALAGAGAALVEAALVWWSPVDQPARLLGNNLLLNATGQIVLPALLLVMLGSFAVWAALPEGANAAPATLLMLGLVIGAALIQSAFVAALLIFTAGLVGVMLVADAPGGVQDLVPTSAIRTALKYVLVVSLGAAYTFVGLGLNQSPGAGSRAGFGLALAGLALWLGLAPFGMALPELAEATSLANFAVVAAVFQLGSLLLLVEMLGTLPRALFDDGVLQRPLLALAGLTVVVAPIFARGTARQSAALLCVATIGQLVFGIALGTRDGMRAALAGIPAYALALALIGAAASMLEAYAPGRQEDKAALYDRPVAAVALMVGLLLLVGLPPLGGWIAKALLWRAALAYGRWTFLLVVAGHALLIAAAVRLVRLALLRRPDGGGPSAPPLPREGAIEALPTTVPAYAPLALRAFAVGLIVLALLLGVYPRPLLTRVELAVEGLRFAEIVGRQP
jgi:NADH-quinone oxidoreductase subunit N